MDCLQLWKPGCQYPYIYCRRNDFRTVSGVEPDPSLYERSSQGVRIIVDSGNSEEENVPASCCRVSVHLGHHLHCRGLIRYGADCRCIHNPEKCRISCRRGQLGDRYVPGMCKDGGFKSWLYCLCRVLSVNQDGEPGLVRTCQ